MKSAFTGLQTVTSHQHISTSNKITQAIITDNHSFYHSGSQKQDVQMYISNLHAKDNALYFSLQLSAKVF